MGRLVRTFFARSSRRTSQGRGAQPYSSGPASGDAVLGDGTTPPSEDLPDSPPHYRILSKVGEGGMGVVYKAEDTRLARFVALKFLPESAQHDQAALERFKIEARAASALNHPNICTIYDVGEHAGRVFLVMEYLEGHTLRAVLRREGLAPDRLLDLGIQIAEGLGAAHTKGIVHRDIKPENIFVTGDERAKILDFGVAKLQPRLSRAENEANSELSTQTAEPCLTRLGAPLGTFAYMSPEQARGESVDARSDIFSLGSVIFEMAARRAAFAGRNAAEICSALLTLAPVLPPQRDARFKRNLQGILDKALEKRREFRYQHAADIAADFRRLRRDLSAEVAEGPGPRSASNGDSPFPSARPQSFWPRSLVGDLANAVLLGILVFFAHHSLDDRPSGRFLRQFQIALLQERVRPGLLDDADFESGGRYLPLIVDISALHPDKRLPTDRRMLDALVDELRRQRAVAIGIDLAVDDVQVSDFQFFQKWLTHSNIRVGVYHRAVERREAWLGRPEFAPLAAGIAVPADNPQQAFSYSRRWYLDSSGEAGRQFPRECTGPDDSANCKEDLVQLPVALWLVSERRRIAAENPGRLANLEANYLSWLDERHAGVPDRAIGNQVEFGSYVIDYTYLKDLRRDVITLPPGEVPGDWSPSLAFLRSLGNRIAERIVLIGDLHDTSDQRCYTGDLTPLPGVLIHAASLATLSRGTVFAATSAPRSVILWGGLFAIGVIIVGLRAFHWAAPRLRAWPFQYLEVATFSVLSAAVLVTSEWLARTEGTVWPHYLWVAAALLAYPFFATLCRSLLALPRMLQAVAFPGGHARGG